MAALLAISGERSLFVPVFNYDYASSRTYYPASAVSQVGALNEHLRLHMEGTRCGPPIFNFFTNSKQVANLPCAGDIDPFGSETVFSLLHRAGAQVLMYGATLASFTPIHFVERLYGGPPYRYDKVFTGCVHSPDGSSAPVSLNYHCRPLGRSLEYDWKKLRIDLEQNRCLKSLVAPGADILLIDLAQTCQFWLSELRSDPLYFLDGNSRAWVEVELDRLGRRFLISDFEALQ